MVVRTDEMKRPSGRENKREAMSKLPIDETILAMWQRHNSSMAVYQRITRMSKQASSLNVGMSHYPLDVYTCVCHQPSCKRNASDTCTRTDPCIEQSCSTRVTTPSWQRISLNIGGSSTTTGWLTT